MPGYCISMASSGARGIADTAGRAAPPITGDAAPVFFYRVYGISLSCDVPLPELTPVEGTGFDRKADLAVTLEVTDCAKSGQL